MAAELDLDDRFRNRVQQGFATVEGWENEDLLRQCREELVPKEFYGQAKNEREAVTILAKHFQTNVMTWVNCPPCDRCGTVEHVDDQNTKVERKPVDENDEQCRVEIVWCKQCETTSEFPRYNSVRRLLQSRRGRCGEYANLFGCLCRAVGLETRYVLDFTDHVWTEVNLSGEWVHVDSCEGVVDENSMYEAGWGKKLSFVIAFTTQHVTDVTPLYTCRWTDADFQARRRAVTSSEEAGSAILKQINQQIANRLPAKERVLVDQQAIIEQRFLAGRMMKKSWDHVYKQGRISGSHTWKVTRNETGNANNDESLATSTTVKFHIEPFYPARPNLEVRLRPNRREILVNGASCAIGLAGAVSVVVLDETILGFVLQSRCCASMAELAEFVSSLPTGRIVAMIGDRPNENGDNKTNQTIEHFMVKEFSKLGGFDTDALNSSFVFFGQMKLTPDWSRCIVTTAHSDDNEHIFSYSKSIETAERSLRTLRFCRPTKVLCRLPETVMPLQTQNMAPFAQKDIAVRSFLSKHSSYYGYTTKQGSPVYLLGAQSYPFVSKTDEEWHTFVMFPKSFVPETDKGILESYKSEIPSFDVPVDASNFAHLGPYLLKSATDGLGSAEALYNCRLVGLYFSAHWCGPCRSFTPMLCEFYEVLKEAFPSHGLEIVFVSGDRNPGEFEQYYSTMPWLAVPGFQNQLLSAMYQVQGIPSLVILDTVSGQIVVPNSMARKEVHQACQRGEDGICDLFRRWLQNVPAETTELLSLLETSCEPIVVEELLIPEAYLTSEEYQSQRKARESLISELMEDGLDRRDATDAAYAVEKLSTEETAHKEDSYEPGSLTEGFAVLVQRIESEENSAFNRVLALADKVRECRYDPATIIGSIEIARKYLSNCIKTPHSARFRKIDLSFKVVDASIGRVEGGVDILESLGFQNEICGDSYALNIPVHADLHGLDRDIGQLIENLRKM